eukprot:g3987.t1
METPALSNNRMAVLQRKRRSRMAPAERLAEQKRYRGTAAEESAKRARRRAAAKARARQLEADEAAAARQRKADEAASLAFLKASRSERARARPKMLPSVPRALARARVMDKLDDARRAELDALAGAGAACTKEALLAAAGELTTKEASLAKLARRQFRAWVKADAAAVGPHAITVGPHGERMVVEAGWLSREASADELAQAGGALRAGQAACHVIAHSNGGPQHLLNTYHASEGWNTMFRAAHDPAIAYVAGIFRAQLALLVSHRLSALRATAKCARCRTSPCKHLPFTGAGPGGEAWSAKALYLVGKGLAKLPLPAAQRVMKK